jgi:type I restriction enzyme, S subunit
LSEQKAIAHILGTLDDKIELNRKSNKTLEGIAKALFKSWFVDFDPVIAKAEGRQTGLPDEISELFPDSFEESDLGEIPKGWSQTSIGTEANLLTGFPFQSALFANSPPGVRLARGMNVKEGFFLWDSQSRFWRGKKEEFEKYFLDVGDILIGMDGSKVGKNWVRVRESDLPCLLVQRVARLRYESSIGETFLRFLVGSAEFTAYVVLVKTGTSIPHISLKQIKEYNFTRPEKSDNRLFAAYEEISLPMMRKVDNNCAQSIVLGSLRDSLLPRLISGELRVPDAEKMLEEAGV